MMAGRKYRPNEREMQVEEDLPWFGPLNYANDAAFLAPDYIRAGKKEKKNRPLQQEKLGARVYEATKNGAETSIELIHDSRFGSVNLFFLAVFCPDILLFLLLFFYFSSFSFIAF
jgi:hypothetical protein